MATLERRASVSCWRQTNGHYDAVPECTSYDFGSSTEPALRRLTLTEILRVTAIPMADFKSLRSRGQLGLAFGRCDAYDGLSYVELDGLGLLVAGTLAGTYSRTFAAQLTRVWWDVWVHVAARAEATNEPAHFCVVQFINPRGEQAHMVCGAYGNITDDAIAQRLEMLPQAEGSVGVTLTAAVNVTDLIAFMRKTATKEGIDLREAFVWPPDDPRTIELLKPWEEACDRMPMELITKGKEILARRAGRAARATIEERIAKPMMQSKAR
jgi:hypothetical protein